MVEQYGSGDPAAGTLHVVVEGACHVGNARLDGVPVYLERPICFSGTGVDPSLTVTGAASYLMYRTDDVTVEDLSLTLDAHNGSNSTAWVFGDIGGTGDAKLFRLDGVHGDFDSTGDGFLGANVQVVDSTITMDCEGSLGILSQLMVGNSTLTATGGTGFTMTGTDTDPDVHFSDPADITITVDSGTAISSAAEMHVQTPSALSTAEGWLRYLVP